MLRTIPFVACFAAACATVRPGEAGPTLPPGETVHLTHSATGPEVAALIEAFYGKSLEAAVVDQQLHEALARYPDNPDLHEVAAYLALLRGDADGSELHFLRAALDVGAAAPVLYLRGLDPSHELVVQTCRLLALEHPDPEVRAAARHMLVRADRLQGDVAGAEAQVRALGTLQNWRVIGAFDNDEGKGFNARYPPEDLITHAGPVDLTGSMPGILVPVRWRRVSTLNGSGAIPLDGAIPFDSMMWPNRQAVAYAASFLDVQKAEDAILWLSSDMPLRVFIDGELALSRETVAAAGDPDNLAVAWHLSSGNHTLLIKSANRGSSWWLGARLTDRGGKPLSGVSASSEPPGLAAGAGSDRTKAAAPNRAPSFEELPTIRGLKADLDNNRAAFLAGLIAVRSGDPKLGVRKEATFAKQAPGNPLALFALALASRANDEQGKTLDLLNEGVKRFGTSLPQFLTERARRYMDKNLLEKSQADAEAFLVARPHDLEGELLLAEIEGRRSFHAERCRTLELTLVDHPKQTKPLRELSGCWLADGRREDARELLERARKLAPGSYATLDAILDLDAKAFDHRRAESDVRLLRQLFPESLGLLVESGKVAERGQRLVAARRFFQEAHDLSPDSPQPLEQLAELAYRRHEDIEATRLWNEAALRDPGNGLLAERLEHLQPTRLGFIEQFIPTDEAIEAAIAMGDKRVPQDGSHEELLLDDEVTEVHADGSLTRLVTEVTRAVNDQGRDSMIQAYVPTQGRLKLLKAFALSKSGERQEASSVRNGVLRFRNLTVGSTVVLQYVHYAPGGQFLPNEFASEWKFQSVAREHALSRWTLVLAKGRPLHVQISGQVAHTETEQQGFQVHHFEARDVPPLIEEPSSPPTHDLL
jgi:tetratricopeptide (TPR) repeat protein